MLKTTESNQELKHLIALLFLFQANELVSLCCREASLKVKLEMSEAMQEEYRATIKGLEEKLAKLLHGQGAEVQTVMEQLKQAEKVQCTQTGANIRT